MIARLLGPLLRRFLKEDSGVISVQNLFIFMAAGMVSAQAVDVTHLYTVREQLKVAADTAAHSALWTINRNDAPTDPTEATTAARTAAIGAVRWGNPQAGNGNIVETQDITFGTWDAATRTFEADNAARDAVLVTAGRERSSGNVVPTFLYTLIGVGAMNVEATAIYTIYLNECADDGMMSATRIDLTSLNVFQRGVCLYAPRVGIQNSNTFELGTMIQMPDPTQWSRFNPNSTFEQNTGLRDALRPGHFDFYILERIKAAGNLRPGDITLDVAMSTASRELPSFMNRALVSNHIALPSTSVTPASFTAGRVHTRTCTGNQELNFAEGTYSNFVLLTNCNLDLNGKVAIEDAVLSTTSTDTRSIDTSSGQNDGLVLGKDDDCAPGGGARIFTRGGFRAAAKLQVYGSQLLALGPVSFASGGNAGEFHGLSIISADDIQGTSNVTYTGCPNGSNSAIQTAYFRPAW